MSRIAKENGIVGLTLKKRFQETGDLEEAVRYCIAKKKEKMERKATRTWEEETATKERVSKTDLVEGMNATGDESKAIFMAECEKQKRSTRKINNIGLSAYDLSILIGLEYRDLIILLAEGLSIDDIKGKYQNRQAGEESKVIENQSLLDLCRERNLDFTFMYRAIFTYRKEVLEAVQEYKNNGNRIPIKWINERYGQILEKLGIGSFQVSAIVQMLQNDRVTLGEALETNIVRKNAIAKGLPTKWGEAVYGLAHMRGKIGLDFHSEICINQGEIEFISSCNRELLELKRKIQGDTAQMPRQSGLRRPGDGIEL